MSYAAHIAGVQIEHRFASRARFLLPCGGRTAVPQAVRPASLHTGGMCGPGARPIWRAAARRRAGKKNGCFRTLTDGREKEIGGTRSSACIPEGHRAVTPVTALNRRKNVVPALGRTPGRGNVREGMSAKEN